MATAFNISDRYRAHQTPGGHAERVQRIDTLLGIAKNMSNPGIKLISSNRVVDENTLLSAHTRRHIDQIRNTRDVESCALDPDTHTCPDSYDVACHGVGALIETADAVLDGTFDNAFVALRPPGHHAERDRAMGFCLFNNVALAAKHLQSEHGLQRVMIIDWDVHHGNGTQDIFFEDDTVLFVSIHQHPLYPGTGAATETGIGCGRGTTINIPLPSGCTDADYAAVMSRIVAPAAQWFDPEFILVSAGFDAHANDPLAGMNMSDEGFAALAARVLDLADEHCSGKLLAVLEGGYDLDALRGGVQSVLDVFAGQSAPEIESSSTIDAIIEVVRELHPGWATPGG